MKIQEYGKWTRIQVTEPTRKTITLKGHLPPNEIRKKYPSASRYAYAHHGKWVNHNLIPVTFINSRAY